MSQAPVVGPGKRCDPLAMSQTPVVGPGKGCDPLAMSQTLVVGPGKRCDPLLQSDWRRHMNEDTRCSKCLGSAFYSHIDLLGRQALMRITYVETKGCWELSDPTDHTGPGPTLSRLPAMDGYDLLKCDDNVIILSWDFSIGVIQHLY